MPGFDIDPCAALAMKACITSMQCLLAIGGDAVASIQAQASFTASASADLKVSIDANNACFLAALALAFAAASQALPPIPPLPTLPVIPVPALPTIPPLPSIPGITITYAVDGVTPIHIDF